jgi:ComF family protein
MDKWSDFIQQQICPASCLFCGEPGYHHNDLCKPCHSSLPWLENYCKQCGIELPVKTERCGSCQKKPPPFEKTISLVRYEERTRYLITSLKFSTNYPASRLMGTLMAQRLQTETSLPELLIPVPLHPTRYRSRGFNQAIEISRSLSVILNIPMDNYAVKRIINTGSQSKLHAKERHKNIRGAFQVKGAIKAKHIAIIDDVITTGSTVTELAKVLKRAGVERIDVCSFARA